MQAFRWRCPFCEHNATITDENYATSRFQFNLGSKYEHQAVRLMAISCPNPDCREYTLSASVHDHVNSRPNRWSDLEAKQTWQLIPAAQMRVFPEYVPAAIVADYREACQVRDLSPKASATLSRRCLQGMIRDFWGVTKKRLVDEIDAIEEKVDPMTWAAIDAVRKIGNIGAHMEKNIDLIIDVEPQEAQLLIGLIETLVDDWYIAKHLREQRLVGITKLAGDKQAARNPQKAENDGASEG